MKEALKKKKEDSGSESDREKSPSAPRAGKKARDASSSSSSSSSSSDSEDNKSSKSKVKAKSEKEKGKESKQQAVPSKKDDKTKQAVKKEPQQEKSSDDSDSDKEEKQPVRRRKQAEEEDEGTVDTTPLQLVKVPEAQVRNRIWGKLSDDEDDDRVARPKFRGSLADLSAFAPSAKSNVFKQSDAYDEDSISLAPVAALRATPIPEPSRLASESVVSRKRKDLDQKIKGAVKRQQAGSSTSSSSSSSSAAGKGKGKGGDDKDIPTSKSTQSTEGKPKDKNKGEDEDEDEDDGDDFGPAVPGRAPRPPPNKDDVDQDVDDEEMGPAKPTMKGDGDKGKEGDEHNSDDDDVGPAKPVEKKLSKKAQRRQAEENKVKIQLDRLPTAQMYEKSYMHREVVSHIAVSSQTHYIATASKDGFVKFWKKTGGGIEFAKTYRAHLGEITGMCMSWDGFLLATVATDKQLKIYDVVDYDMIHIVKLEFSPSCCEWIHDQNTSKPRVAVGHAESGDITVFYGEGPDTAPIRTISLHSSPVSIIKYNPKYHVAISADANGMLEYWSSDTFEFPQQVLKFEYQTETNLYEFVKNKTMPLSLEYSPNGELFVCMGKDRQVRVFNFLDGKLLKKLDESLKVHNDHQMADNPLFKLDNIDFGRRMAIERELEKTMKTTSVPPSNAIFDDSGLFILYPTLLGIKVVNVKTNELVRILGKVENTERFLTIALFQGTPREMGGSAAALQGQGLIEAAETALAEKKEDPCLFTLAFKKARFYWFSAREPIEPDPNNLAATGRDVFNEKPTRDITAKSAVPKEKLGTTAVIHTTMGDISLLLYTDECPKTCENFTTHSKNNYYNGTILHRVINEFMIQMGDPQGDGTGGESIWGGEFEDEFHTNLRHDRPGTLSMANAGPNTNGSQFFITTVPCPWLDKKHTVFGRVTKGMDVVYAIEKVKVSKENKPLIPIKIVNIDVK